MKKIAVIFGTVSVVMISWLSQGGLCDSLVVKYKNGKKQVVQLKYNAEEIKSIVLRKEIKLLGQGVSNSSRLNVNKIDKIRATKVKHQKSNTNEIDLGNGIKAKWESPNPYLPPANE